MLGTGFTFSFFGISDVGLVRDHNEDAWAAFAEKGLFLVADGMGGHKAGEVAAQDAITGFSKHMKQLNDAKPRTKEDTAAFFAGACQAVNEAIFEKGKQQDYLGMGTTLCALYFWNHEALVAHVGDSRVYCFRKNALRQLTSDHSLVNELLSIGVIKEKDVENFPYKHILTRALGTHPSVEPALQFFPVQTADLFLLCTDGLTNYVPMKEIEKILARNEEEIQFRCELLVEEAKRRGGGDNITVLGVQVFFNE